MKRFPLILGVVLFVVACGAKTGPESPDGTGGTSTTTTSTTSGNICANQSPTCGEYFTECNTNSECCSGYCGGRLCRGCDPTGTICSLVNGQCISDVCRKEGDGFFRCQAPTCTDHVQNGTETDADCGGPDCPGRCHSLDLCYVDSDCKDKHCVPHPTGAKWCATPQCDDEIQNGGETAVDCGSVDCGGCTGASCSANYECHSYSCQDGTCN